ncbi:MAG: Lrp/AsnC family transcriptional regulator [Paracoccaceae bacterium]
MPGPALDDRDLRILAILSREGRIAKTDLARRVNLSPTPCGERLKRLEEAGLVRGYRADIALARLAPHITVFVLVEIESHRAESFRAFERAIAVHEEIVACWSVGGGFDYVMQVVARDVDAYQRLIDALLESRAGLARYFTYIVTKEAKAPGPPPLGALLGADPA